MKEPGASCGPLGGPRAIAVLRAIALAATDTPSIEEIRREAGCSRSTVYAVLAALREVGAIEVDARYRLVEAKGARGAQARRTTNRYRLPTLREFERRYESSLRTALHPEEESLYRRRQAPPRRRRVDRSEAWEAPGAYPAAEEIEILSVEIRPAAAEVAREEEAGGESAAPPAPHRPAETWPESLAEIARRRSAALFVRQPGETPPAAPGKLLGVARGDPGGRGPATLRPKTGRLWGSYAARSDPRPDG